MKNILLLISFASQSPSILECASTSFLLGIFTLLLVAVPINFGMRLNVFGKIFILTIICRSPHQFWNAPQRFFSLEVLPGVRRSPHQFWNAPQRLFDYSVGMVKLSQSPSILECASTLEKTFVDKCFPVAVPINFGMRLNLTLPLWKSN